MTLHTATRVSAVIPTMLRPSLHRAIQSVREQVDCAPVEVVVVVDGPPIDVPTHPVLRTADHVEFTGGGTGAATARNLGVHSATGEVVAFLDDDDEWGPTKIFEQLQAAASAPCDAPVVVSRVQQRVAGSTALSDVVPYHTKHPDQPVADYLFCNRRPHLGRAGIWTSSILLPKDLAQQVPWDDSLRRHQDWDLLLRLEREPRTSFVHLDQPLTVINIGSTDSISASTDWRTSLAWAHRWQSRWTARTFADFVMAQPFRYAASCKSVTGMTSCLRAIAAAKHLPSWGPLQIGIGGLVPRKLAMSILVKLHAKKTT